MESTQVKSTPHIKASQVLGRANVEATKPPQNGGNEKVSATPATYPSIRFAKRDPEDFFKTLRQRVNAYFKDNKIERTGGALAIFKTTINLALFFIPFAFVLAQVFPVWATVVLYGLMGVGASEIGLATMHDANHGSFSKKKWVNNMMSYSMNIIGGSSFTWKIQHNVLHHSYTNIYEMDEDIHDKPFLRLSPHGIYKPHHRFQHIYGLFLYTLATLSWVLLKDWRQLSTYNKSGMTAKQGFSPRRETLIMAVSKIIYFAYIIALPIAIGVPVWAVLTGFVLLHMVSGLIITTVFQLAHVVEGPEHFVPVKTGTMENTWAIHQLKSTANFSTKSSFMTWVTGGLNHQIEHHLFPHVSHKHYQKLSTIVRATAEECGLPYYEHPRFLLAIKSHLRVLKAFGRKPAAT